MIPNRLDVVQQVKAAHPEAWRHAHTGNTQTEDFIRLVAAALHAEDRRFGLNGKRGDPRDISDDAINYSGEGADYDPTHGNTPVTVIDVIAAAGSPAAAPQWQVVTNPAQPAAAAWVQPRPVTPAPPPSPPPPPPAPTYPGDALGVLIAVPLFADYGEKGEPPNPGMGVWVWRAAWDMAHFGLTPEQAVAKHRAEWRAALGLPPR